MEKKLALALNLIAIRIAAMESAELSLGKPIEIKDHVTCTGHESVVYSVCVTLDNRIVSASPPDRTLRIWDMQGNEQFANKIPGASAVFVTNNNKIILITSSYEGLKKIDRSMHFLDTNGIELASWKTNTKYVFCVSVTPEARIVLGSEDKIIIGDMNGKKLATCKGHKGHVRSVSVATETRLISGSDDKTVGIWNLKGKKLGICKGHTGTVL